MKVLFSCRLTTAAFGSTGTDTLLWRPAKLDAIPKEGDFIDLCASEDHTLEGVIKKVYWTPWNEAAPVQIELRLQAHNYDQLRVCEAVLTADGWRPNP